MAEPSNTPEALANSVSHEIHGEHGHPSGGATNPADDRQPTQVSGDQGVRLLVHRIPNLNVASQSDALDSRDDQRCHLLPGSGGEKAECLEATRQMILVTVFVLVAAGTLLIASCALAGRACWTHSILVLHCLLELHIVVILLFLVIGPAVTLLWRFWRDDATSGRNPEALERVTSVTISAFEILTAFAFLLAVVHILYLPPLSSFKNSGHQAYRPAAPSEASPPWSTSFVSIFSPSFHGLTGVGGGGESDENLSGTIYNRGVAPDGNGPHKLSLLSISGLAREAKSAAKMSEAKTRTVDPQRMKIRRRISFLENVIDLHRHKESFRPKKVLSSFTEDPQARDLSNRSLPGYQEEKPVRNLINAGRRNYQRQANATTAQVTASSSSAHRWKTPLPERQASSLGRNHPSGSAGLAGTSSSRLPDKTARQREDTAPMSLLESLLSKNVNNEPSRPAESWMLTLRTIISIGTVSFVILMTLSGILTRINISLKSRAASQFITCCYVAALAGFLAAILSFLDISRQPGPGDPGYERLPFGEAAPTALAAYLLVDGVTNILMLPETESGSSC
ncbi:putative transmembrane protein [Toxoplasma gondii GAB2-2007-GAL-DOM2]|uniref:Transmembrane protein n=9 Tax=Toxoplasma gondii TaxID=5811 RepID=A0A125YWS8_TOXGV|nr:hypothetical protein TGGT1_203930 [Toxoplasma gondii GT1]ESS33100.1 putative transmembrane protein [Toxoplasma gondii VEG]KAF4642784.1 hypothetical protein TGRH88_035100 [Toxoplasma gondii]KFG37956.1 putative transmembrane protein [Toxoplasma gondii GAB2-2007-GAL-DOM2]KFG39434.1 putative transmembrane protein [Toxoplasma gondii FOU]KFG46273.1 putative transmembrane protein [Toxoplasma gondii p89]KFH05615.1 putative transmembrane protein [Toxoplasma gondii MAS]PUA89335.1 putative transmemb